MTKIWCQFWCQYFHHIGINQCNLLQLFCYKINCYKQIQTCVNLWKPSFDAHNQGVVGSIPTGPTQNQEVTTSKIVTFFGASPDADCKSSQVRMLTDSVSIWCQDLVKIGIFLITLYALNIHCKIQIRHRGLA